MTTQAEFQNLITELEKGERLYRGFKDGIKLAGIVANLMQSEQDAIARAKKAQEDELRIVELVGKRIQEAEATYDDLLAQVKVLRNEMEALKFDARNEADRIVKTARENAEKIAAEYKFELNDIAAAVAQAKDMLRQTNDAIHLANVEKQKVERGIEDAKAKFRELIG